jgi:hypothetical protein
VFVAGHFEIALELEEEELGGAQVREGGWKSGRTWRRLARERDWDYHNQLL